MALLLALAALLAVACVSEPAEPPGAPPAGGAPASTPQTAATLAPAAPQTLTASGPFGFGRDATADEILAWDIDVAPSGAGLPAGSGDVAAGERVYLRQCALCHGRSGEGVEGMSGALVMPYDPDAPWPPFPRTVGNYWPYATTLFDYVRRAMPSNAPGSLTADEVYAVVAWLLHQNGIVAEDAVMDAQSLPEVRMPARARFVPSPESP